MDSPQSRKVSSSGVAAPSTALKDRFRRMQRGMTMEEVQQYGVLNDEEATELFKGIDLDEKTIKKLPKKQRPYYEHLAQLKEHYEEVDQLLAGEIPKNIASSFKRPQVRATIRQDSSLTTSQKGLARSLRRSSSRTIKPARENGDAEAGEEDGLLSGAQKEEKRERTAKIALNVNTGVNVVLVVAKLVAVLYSSSISLLASLVDSALDLLSTFIILGTSYAIGIKSDKHLYPAGKRRFEPLGVLIFSVAMIASFVQVFIEAFQRARDTSDNAPVELSTIGLVTMIVTIAVKLVLWIWCSRIPSSGVQALAQDAENDVWLNSMSLAFPWIGHRIGWRLLDPIGGMVLSAYIIFEWIKTLLQNFAKLSGKTASRDQITRVLYLVTRFNPVLEIKEVECYHIGDELIVEVDVIFPQASSLHFAHDVSETIQCTLESLDGVIRAYVQ
ncbi:hypothetical protein BD324DRAFT_579516 [Kockovaella imperatae]|uniref:Cation efflux protein transmembrane domain-containing protein n=1 Tax=Kockovaella imperatae TaxID=4999 RepID=A0A1Y1UHW5_9TREE|nr:hypothetical protein BD324DRAFT_579516 [Kockovaella imperatae]ORX37076.1 hypothetical protein BD324DRAFT_579516 [Kockovaella imperatae]